MLPIMPMIFVVKGPNVEQIIHLVGLVVTLKVRLKVRSNYRNKEEDNKGVQSLLITPLYLTFKSGFKCSFKTMT